MNDPEPSGDPLDAPVPKPAPELHLRDIDFSKVARCRGCRRFVYWAVTAKNGKKVMLDESAQRVARRLAGAGWVVPNAHVHFVTCPNAAQFRSYQKNAPSERID